MKRSLLTRSKQNRIPIVLLAGILSSAICFICMKLWNADLRYVLIGQGGDAVLEQMGIQNMIETGTRNFALRLGGSSGSSLYEYPVSDFINYAIMFLISLFTKNSALVMNLFYLLCFPLTAMTGTWALLEMRISPIPALFAATLFPFIPYHFYRNENHLLLSAYYLVPLACLTTYWLLGREADSTFSRQKTMRENIRDNRTFLLAIFFSLLISSTGIYYAFFSCFFMAVAMLVLLFSDRRVSKSVRTAFFCIVTTIFGVALNFLPTFLYRWQGGDRGTPLSRPGEAAEIYGLKIVDLLIPATAHRIPAFRTFAESYHATELVSNENITVSLGIIGAATFLCLLMIPFFPKKRFHSVTFQQLRKSSLFVIAGVLLAMQGGISALICRLLLTSVRAYSRICVFLAFYIFVATAVLLQRAFFGSPEGPSHKTEDRPRSAVKYLQTAGIAVVLAALLVGGLYDQITLFSEPNYAGNIAADKSTQAFFSKAENAVPAGTLVYVLPYTDFPEPYTSYSSSPYALMNGYLCTKTLRWSYGAMTGTKSAEWARKTSVLSAKEMISELRKEGYGAVYIDLLNYPDDSLVNLSADLTKETKATPIISEDGTKIFLTLEPAG